MKKRNLNKLIKSIEEYDRFDYTESTRCVGAVLARTVRNKSGKPQEIAAYLGVPDQIGENLYWGRELDDTSKGSSNFGYKFNTPDGEKSRALRLLNELKLREEG